MPPPPPPAQTKVVNINIDNKRIAGDDSQIISALQLINERLFDTEESINNISSNLLALGETASTAFPGDRGFANEIAIAAISSQLTGFITTDKLSEELLGYATNEHLGDIVSSLNQRIDDLDFSEIQDGISGVVSSIVSTMIDDDYTDILNQIEDFQNQIKD